MKKIPILRAIQVRMTPIVATVLLEEEMMIRISGEDYSRPPVLAPEVKRKLRTRQLHPNRQDPALVIFRSTKDMKDKIEIGREENHKRKRG